MLTQMAKYLDTVYVSGWQSSSTASSSDEPGPDLADYPYVRSRISRVQLFSYERSADPCIKDHRAQQSRPPLYGAALPRSQAAPGAN